jgi:F-type H+-transporting ATPase subunit epsilon
MRLEIISPEATLYQGEVTSVIVPGVNGSFQLLERHAAIASVLQKGELIIKGLDRQLLTASHAETFLLIQGGAVEMKHNKLIVLID